MSCQSIDENDKRKTLVSLEKDSMVVYVYAKNI